MNGFNVLEIFLHTKSKLQTKTETLTNTNENNVVKILTFINTECCNPFCLN